jgi:hypothetical protein
MAFVNIAARRRRRLARRLHGYLKQLDLLGNLREVSRATGVDVDILRSLDESGATPKLETLERIAAYIENRVKCPVERDAKPAG